MRFCQPHWNALRAAIADRGLSDLVAKSGEEAVESLARQVSGESDSKKDFDPLMNAHWAIVSNAIKAGGFYLMGKDEDGNEYCPLCEVEHQRADEAKLWIKYATDAQLEMARELGLAPSVQ